MNKTPTADCFVSVVAPLHNDADIVHEFLDDLLACLTGNYVDYEVVLVDDSSDDDTVARVRERIGRFRDVRLLCLSRSFGLETAITAGLESVIGDYIVVMLPDSDPPEMIPYMVDRARRGAGIVVAMRIGRRAEGFLFRACAGVFYWYVNKVLKLGIPPESVDYRVLSRKSVNALIQIKDQLRYIRSFSAYVGYGTDSVLYEPISRRGSPGKRDFLEAINLGVLLIVANSSHPLRVISVFSLGLCALQVLYLLSYAGLYLGSEAAPAGWMTTTAILCVPFVFVFAIAAVLCEYVGRVLIEIQNRPLYFIAEEWDQGSAIVEEQRKNVVNRSVDS